MRRYTAGNVPEVRRLRQLEDENARLKRMMAERDLEIDAMKELLQKNW
jgi:putative transposase